MKFIKKKYFTQQLPQSGAVFIFLLYYSHVQPRRIIRMAHAKKIFLHGGRWGAYSWHYITSFLEHYFPNTDMHGRSQKWRRTRCGLRRQMCAHVHCGCDPTASDVDATTPSYRQSMERSFYD